MLSQADVFICRFLPSLAFLYGKNSTDGDTRFLCLKIFFDTVVLFLEDMAGSTLGQPELAAKEGRKEQIEGVIRQQFLPIYATLVADEDPIPMYAQKLLVMLLDAKCIKTSDILQLKLLSQFFDFLSEDLAGINLHDVRLCLFLACAPEVETQVLSDLQIVRRLGGLLDFVHAKGMEDFLEPVLGLCRVVLIRSVGKGGKGRSYTNANGNGNGLADANGVVEGPQIQDISDLGRHAGIFVELSGSYDPRIAETSSESLVLLLRTVPTAASGAIVSNLARMAHALEVSGNCHGTNILSLLQRRLLFALTVACKEHRSASANKQHPSLARGPDVVALENTLHGLRSSSLPLVAESATAAVMELQQLVRRT